ncbi:MAG TPA: amylo-alpha-1,6-glucosidase [Burkholderiaceae bacterium]|nr:amylo-alpha-1,6-glucosidase [Burkholderiaceae bacterium]
MSTMTDTLVHRLPRLVLDRDLGPGSDPAAPLCEWIVTNGIGGYAYGTLDGVPARRYHGLLVASLSHPRGRHVLIPAIDEVVAHAQGRTRLAGPPREPREEVGGRWRSLREFRLEGALPVWTYQVGDLLIERRLVMPHGHNAVALQWKLLSGPPCRLMLRPYLDMRRQDETLSCGGQPGFRWCGTVESAQAFECVSSRAPALALHMRVSPEAATFDPTPHREPDVRLAVEETRGYEHRVDLHSPGRWEVELRVGTPVVLQAWVDEPPPAPFDALVEAEQHRQAALLDRAGPPDGWSARLTLAGDQFVIQPGTRSDTTEAAVPDDFRSVIAGYPWFGDWGRDTMISLEGLALCTGRYAEARAILHTFGHYIRDGLLPNLFPEGGREALYHTVDATLWFFHAVARYVQYTGDETLIDELYPRLEEVIERHREGTRFGIGVDPEDGLVRAAAEGYQLTWMDAKVDDWVVTPRRGKPVEIQALWFNALCWMAKWARDRDRRDADHLALAAQVRQSFNARYWDAARGHLKDVIDGPDGDDASLRPNQLFAISLDHPVLDRGRWDPVLAVVERELLTPYGLRTLGPREPAYQPHYRGTLRERDAAYHQGTVWPWLLGAYVDAALRAGRHASTLEPLFSALQDHLKEAGIGQLGEVFDAQPPHEPEGCIAQAWSVAECLRAWLAVQRAKESLDG